MKKLLEKIWRQIKHYPWLTIAIIAILLVLLWLVGCVPTTRSPLDPNLQVNRQELQIVVNNFIDKVHAADADLAEKELFRDYIVQQILGATQTGTINPVNVLMGIMSILGIGAIGDNIRKDSRIKIQKQNIEMLNRSSNSASPT